MVKAYLLTFSWANKMDQAIKDWCFNTWFLDLIFSLKALPVFQHSFDSTPVLVSITLYQKDYIYCLSLN